jgi:hypothetical protein
MNNNHTTERSSEMNEMNNNEDRELCVHGYYIGDDARICFELRADDEFIEFQRESELTEGE